MARAWQVMLDAGTDPGDEAAQAELHRKYNMTNSDILNEDIMTTLKKTRRKR